MARGGQVSGAVVTALTPEDVLEEAKDLKGLGKDRVRLGHFLERSWATARALADLKVSFEERLASRSNNVTVGTPSNMSPEQAARFLSPEQLSRFFDRFMQDKLAMAESQRASAEARARQADAVVEALRQVVGSILADPGLDPSSRERIARAVDEAAHLASQAPGRTNQQ